MNEAPKAEGKASLGFEDPTTLARFDALEASVGDNKKNLKIVQNTNWLIIIVLFVAVLALIFAAVYQFIGAIKSDTKSRDQLTQTVQDLQTDMKVLQGRLNQQSTDASTINRSTSNPSAQPQ